MQKYLERAADADEQARHARTETERQAFLEIARPWRSLAEREGDKPPEQERS